MRELWLKVKTSLRNHMLSPGFDDYENEGQAYDDENYYEEEVSHRADTWQEHAIAATAPKTSKYKSSEKFTSDKYIELYDRDRKTTPSLETGVNIMLLSPKHANQATAVTDYLKRGAIVSLNLTDVEDDQGQRIIDVVSGAVHALNGSLERTARTVFIVAPEGVTITNDIKEELSKELPWNRP